MPITGPTTSVTATPIVVPHKAIDGLHAQLLRVTASGDDGDQVRANLRHVIKDVTGASMVVHLQCNQQGQLSFDARQAEGDVALTDKTANQFLPIAAMALSRGATQVKSLPEGLQVICTPVSTPGNVGEVLAAIVVFEARNFHSALFAVELAANYQRFWSRGNVAVANQWKLNSLAAIVELVSNVQQQSSVDAAANILVNDVAKFLGCARVALATDDGDKLQLRAISGLNNFDQSSESATLIREAFAESGLHEDLCVWPAEEHQNSALLAHKVVAEQLNFNSLLTAPLRDIDGKKIGGWLFADNGDLINSERFRNFIRAASPRVAGAIRIVDRSEQGILARAKYKLREVTRERKGKLALVAIALLLGTMLLPLPYRVRCQCVVEPVARRFSVAPFDGMVDEGLVEPGDIVSEGSLLAKMDGRELRWELSAAQAQRGQVEKEREVELSQRNVPQVLISQLEAEELDAQIDVLRYRTAHLEVRAPVSGIVLSGSLEKGQSSPVKTGDVLYEIGPLVELRIEIEVPAGDVAQVATGQKVKIWINGFETAPIVAKIQKLQPRSELRHDQNVFVAKLVVNNADQSLRPGMRGSARITGPLRPLAWNLFHKPWEYAVSRLTWW